MKDSIIEDLRSKSIGWYAINILGAAILVGGLWLLTCFVICVGSN